MTKTGMSKNELEVLKHLSARNRADNECGTSDISEIASTIGISSNEEVQRALYILEGKSLVQPEPTGDFTSSHWKITNVGAKAIEILSL